jgi:type VI secretion system protein ImpF
MNETRRNAQASILDRLIDLDPEVAKEPVQFRLQDLRQVKASVVRDLEHLLNTRRPFDDPPEAFRNLRDSLFMYGLSDFTGHNPKASSVRQQLRLQIERTISRFEPRLRNVVVRLEADAETERTLRFRISAVLIVEPLSEPVTFDTVLDMNRVQFKVAA